MRLGKWRQPAAVRTASKTTRMARPARTERRLDDDRLPVASVGKLAQPAGGNRHDIANVDDVVVVQISALNVARIQGIAVPMAGHFGDICGVDGDMIDVIARAVGYNWNELWFGVSGPSSRVAQAFEPVVIRRSWYKVVAILPRVVRTATPRACVGINPGGFSCVAKLGLYPSASPRGRSPMSVSPGVTCQSTRM